MAMIAPMSRTVGLPPSLALPLQGGGKARGEVSPHFRRRPRRTASLHEGRLPNVPSPLEGEGQGGGARPRHSHADATSRAPRSTP